MEIHSRDDLYTAVLDASERRRSDAAWDIWLSITIIGLMVLVAVFCTRDLRKTFLQPYYRLMTVLREDCPHILESLHLPKVRPPTRSAFAKSL